MRMQLVLDELNKIISNPNIVSVEIKDWKECGEFNGEDPRPILKIKRYHRKITRKIID